MPDYTGKGVNRVRGRPRRSGHAAVICVAAILAAAVLAVVLLKFVFVVRGVEYEGASNLDIDAITRASGVRLGGSIFSVDREKVRQNVDALGEVTLEEVRTRLPSTVVLRVRARDAAGMFLYSGGLVVLDEAGYVMRRVDQVPDEDLVYVTGLHVIQCRAGALLEAEKGQTEGYAAVTQALRQHGAQAYVSELNVEDPEDIRILTRTGVTVKLGGAENMNNKIAWMRTAVADLETRRETGVTLDVQSGTKADILRPYNTD